MELTQQRKIEVFLIIGLGIIGAAVGAGVKSMLDWPLQTQTSPTTTSLRLSLFLPLTVMTAESAQAFMASSLTHQAPSLSAVADLVWPAKATVTFSSGSAVP